jgi:hypothetical protein
MEVQPVVWWQEFAAVFTIGVVWFCVLRWKRRRHARRVFQDFRDAYENWVFSDLGKGTVSLAPTSLPALEVPFRLELDMYQSQCEPAPEAFVKLSVFNQRFSSTLDVDWDTLRLGPSDTQRVYLILATNGLLFRPRTSPINIMYALQRRTFARPKYWRETNNEWLSALKTLLGILKSPGCLEREEDWYLLLDGPKKKLYIETRRQMDTGYCKDQDTGVFSKTDETLAKPKPRVILNVPKKVQCITQPELRPVTKRFATWADGITFFQVFDVRFTLYFAYGVVALDLSTWWERVILLPGCYHLIFMGDDSLLLDGYSSPPRWYEGDFKQFDQSQGEDALQSAVAVMVRLGLSPSVAEEELRSYTCRCKVRYKEYFRFEFLAKWLRATGGGATSLGNSIVNCLAWVHLLTTHRPGTLTEVIISRSMAKLGLEIVGAWSSHPTFLKGWWVVGQWWPLPSQVLKLGKVTTAPTTIVRHKQSERATFRDVAHALAVGLGPIPKGYPLLGPFLHRMRAAGRPRALHGKITESNPHKVRVTHVSRWVPADREAALDMIAMRYHLPKDEVVEMEGLILRSDIPGFVFHPGFLVLVRSDYL